MEVMDGNTVLDGYGVRLEPVAERHLCDLRAACADPKLWEFTFQPNPFVDEAGTSAWFAAARGADTLAFAIVDARAEEVVATTRFFDIDARHRKLEIGWTALNPTRWRTHVNTACKLLLLRYAFDEWNAARVQFKAEAKNARSRRAIERIGATFEGTHRSYRIRLDGEIRDTSFYSVIRPEWPAVDRYLTALMTRYERVASA
jgi:RimJ/RimL family protein N-acetyltransferase